MIAEMVTRVPGPLSKKSGAQGVVFSEQMEGANVWDLDGNRFLDLTSGGGLLPFGSVDNGCVKFSELEVDLEGYEGVRAELDYFEGKKILQVGEGVASAFTDIVVSESVQLMELANMSNPNVDLVVVKAQYLDDLSLKRVSSWCKQWQLPWVADETDFGMFRTGSPFSSSRYNPDYILTAIAGEGMIATSLLFSQSSLEGEGMSELLVALNYADKDLARTNKLQAMELHELLKDSHSEKQIVCVGAYHSIQLDSMDEVARVCHDLLQRGIIVATMYDKVVLLPSLYLALGEIIFAVNHIRLVVEDVNEVSLPWMSEDLRK